MDPIGLNDTFTLVNTTLCVVLIILRLFYYRNNPKLDTLIHRVDAYLLESLHARSARSSGSPRPAAPPVSYSESPGGDILNDSKSNI